MSASFHSALAHLANLELTEQASMDSIFLLREADRSAFLQHITQSFGCTYICLWSYLPLPSNCLLFLDGLYQEESSQQPGPSSGSLARGLFNAYCESVNYVDDQGRVPGFAFKNNLRYMEMKLHSLQRLASSEMQMQFYQEAGIKTVVFMGCASGEIELGISSEPQVRKCNYMPTLTLICLRLYNFQVNLEMEIKSWFPTKLPQPTSQDRPSTSSSSLRTTSLSVDSSEYSLLFNGPSSSFITETPQENALSQIRNIHFPTVENENAAMTKAILAVLSSPSTSSSSQTNLPPVSPAGGHEQAAFRRYRAGLAPVAATTQKHYNMFKRSISFFRNLNIKRRRQEPRVQGNRPTSTQLHHMISERRRREKLNESFQVLRSLLPPGSKKDKASVLSSTTEYISSLKSQVEELSKSNQILESELSTTTTTTQREGGEELSSPRERVNVEIVQVSASTSTSEEARFLDLSVKLRSGECRLLDLVIRVLEFLNQQRNVRLLSVQSSTRMLVESASALHGLVLRLRVEGDEFEECGFQEAVRRVVDHLPH